MHEQDSYPLIVRGVDKAIEIPARLLSRVDIQELTRRTRGRFSHQLYSAREVGSLLGTSDLIDTTHTPRIDFIETIQGGHSILIQLIDQKRWKILCLIEQMKQGWSSFETLHGGIVGIFHTGTHLPLGNIAASYLMHDLESTITSDLIQIQRNQPDIIEWRDNTF